MTNHNRWLNPENLGHWSARTKAAAQMIPEGSTVFDLGCGDMSLEQELQKCSYIPCDLVARDLRTIVCDFNRDCVVVPDTTTHIAVLGVLEYLSDCHRFIRELSQSGRPVVISYHPTVPGDDRSDWMNSFSRDELNTLFGQAGYTVTKRQAVSDNEELMYLSMNKAYCNIITNHGGYGLRHDYEVIRDVLVGIGYHVQPIQFNDPGAITPAHLNIFLEVMVPSLLRYARQNWLVPNPEWWDEQPNDQYLSRIARVLCKTKDSLRIFSEKVGTRAEYIGFESLDIRKTEISKEPRFLHIAGKSEAKNTAAVIGAWADHKLPYPLTLVTSQPKFIRQATGVAQITHRSRVDDDEQVRLMNSHQFHLCPSKYEGWGHYFHEALSTGSVVLTTDAPPMNEFAGVGANLRIPAHAEGKQRLGTLNMVTADDVAAAVHRAASLPDEEAQQLSVEARQAFDDERLVFREKFSRLVNDPKKFTGRRLTVAVLGNHTAPFCTESELDWTFEHLGHRVIKYQENKDTTDAILMGCLTEKVDLLVYVHTHGWDTPGTITVQQLIEALRKSGITTTSFHLDLYWGLNGDKREDRVGNHPFWHTDYVFTADGGHQEQFKGRGVNHFWLPPAVVERGCYVGTPQNKFAVEVAFVGSKGYHAEYSFRAQLVDWLEQTYGPRFKRFNGDTTGTVREKDLNDLYASVKVVVGDSCFAGIPHYWSDRVPETLGRGGFLIHPEVVGLNIPGLVTYRPGDLTDLKQKIDYYLEHENERRECIALASNDVRDNHTYTDRVHTMIKTMGLDQYAMETAPYPESKPVPPPMTPSPSPAPRLTLAEVQTQINARTSAAQAATSAAQAALRAVEGDLGKKVGRLAGMGYDVLVCDPGSPILVKLREYYPGAAEERINTPSGQKILFCARTTISTRLNQIVRR